VIASHIEREVKLQVETGYEIPDLNGFVDGLQAVTLSELKLEAVYYDTPDLRLARAGLTLRRRSEAGADRSPTSVWTLKLPLPAGGTALSRQEMNWPGADRSIPHQASDLVRAYRRRTELGPVARLTTDRRRMALTAADGKPVAEIDDDFVSVMDNDRLVDQFREIEVELGDGISKSMVHDLLDRLRVAGATTGDRRPKVVRALGERASSPPDVELPAGTSNSTVDEIVHGFLARGYLELVAHAPGAYLGDDPEEVHQARVAVRRLRSDLQTLRSVLDPGWVDHMRSELGWVGAALGAVRDIDVLMVRLTGHVEGLEPSDAPAGAMIITRLTKERSNARRRLRAVLGSERLAALLDLLVVAMRALPLATPPKRSPFRARAAMPPLVARPWKRLSRTVEALGEDPSDDALHQVRIRTKRLRYACEAVQPVIGRPARKLGNVAGRLQDTLGELHDAVVGEAWLREAAAAGTVEEALVAGQMLASLRREAEQSREAWPEDWHRLEKKRLVEWLA